MSYQFCFWSGVGIHSRNNLCWIKRRESTTSSALPMRRHYITCLIVAFNEGGLGGIYSKGLLVVYFVVLVAGFSWPQWRCDPIRITLTHLKYVLAAALYRATLDHHCCEAHTRWAFWYQNNADLHFKKLFTHRPTFFAPETWHKRHRQPFKPKD